MFGFIKKLSSSAEQKDYLAEAISSIIKDSAGSNLTTKDIDDRIARALFRSQIPGGIYSAQDLEKDKNSPENIKLVDDALSKTDLTSKQKELLEYLKAKLEL